MNITLRAALTILAAATLLSCAKQDTIDSKEIERNTLAKWVEKYAPGAQLLTDGIYYEVIESAPAGAPAVEVGQWVICDYQVRDIDRNIVYTRDSLTAAKLGSATKYTHYVPDYFVISSSARAASIMKAQYYALEKMKLGDKWRLYAPSDQVYDSKGLSNDIGYGGQFSLSQNKPAIIDNFQIISIVDDPDVHEQLQVEELAFSRKPQGWDLSEKDAVMRHYYRQYLNPQRPPITDTIPTDSVARIYFKARFLDGFLFDTNIDSVWINNFGSKRVHYATTSDGTDKLVDDTVAIKITRKVPYQVSSDMPNKVFSFLFAEEDEELMLRYGDSLRVVLTSPYAYGTTGRPGYVYGSDDSNSAYLTNYLYNQNYYGYGGYSNYGYDYYNSYNPYYSNYYNTTSDQTTYPVAEIKEFTPLIYELVVLLPEGKTSVSGDDDDDDEG